MAKLTDLETSIQKYFKHYINLLTILFFKLIETFRFNNHFAGGEHREAWRAAVHGVAKSQT